MFGGAQTTRREAGNVAYRQWCCQNAKWQVVFWKKIEAVLSLFNSAGICATTRFTEQGHSLELP
jgi:hypothetical protein